MTTSLLDLLSSEETWRQFLEYKESLAVPKRFTSELRSFIDEKEYTEICESILEGGVFPLARKSVISKMGSDKKRIVYTYPEPENTVLKLLTYLILRKYDGIFKGGLYSFRPGRTAKDAVKRLTRIRGIHGMYAYKADIHNYFNAIPVDKFLPVLKSALFDDERLYAFLEKLLSEEYVIDRKKAVKEEKGIMAGTPLSSFYANLYLSDLDAHFDSEGVVYARYSDDIIIFTENREKAEEHSGYIKDFLAKKGLEINPKKEYMFSPGEGFEFLGFRCAPRTVDIAPATLKKLKGKMRRKRDSLTRWAKRNEIEPEKAARAFIRIFIRKLLEAPGDNELSWGSWFFPVINTTVSLHEIDIYAQDCIRYIISGRHTKARYNVKYDDLKSLGYVSLVNRYRRARKEMRK